MNSEVKVHVLNLRVDDWHDLGDVLSPSEKSQRDLFYFERDRQAFTVCRAGLRQRLGAELGVSPRALRFRVGPYGKPQLCDDVLSFNVSHSEDLALIAITHLPCVGIDIEFERPLDDLFALAARNFSSLEQDALHRLPETLRHAGFFRCWSHKEAFIKAIGLGLSFPLKQFDVNLAPREPAELLAIRDPRYATKEWVLQALCIASGYSAALVTPGAARVVGPSTKAAQD